MGANTSRCEVLRPVRQLLVGTCVSKPAFLNVRFYSNEEHVDPPPPQLLPSRLFRRSIIMCATTSAPTKMSGRSPSFSGDVYLHQNSKCQQQEVRRSLRDGEGSSLLLCSPSHRTSQHLDAPRSHLPDVFIWGLTPQPFDICCVPDEALTLITGFS